MKTISKHSTPWHCMMEAPTMKNDSMKNSPKDPASPLTSVDVPVAEVDELHKHADRSSPAPRPSG